MYIFGYCRKKQSLFLRWVCIWLLHVTIQSFYLKFIQDLTIIRRREKVHEMPKCTSKNTQLMSLIHKPKRIIISMMHQVEKYHLLLATVSFERKKVNTRRGFYLDDMNAFHCIHCTRRQGFKSIHNKRFYETEFFVGFLFMYVY